MWYNKNMNKQTKITYRMIERLSKIHEMIKTGNFPNSNDFANETESSAATISRDIEYMRDRMNAPIKYNYVQKGFFYTKNYEPNFQNYLSEKDLNTLIAAKNLLSHYKNTPIYKEACNIINLISESSINKNTALIDRITVAPTEEVAINQNLWNVIQDALNKNLILKFDYTNRWGKLTEQRKVHPYQIVLDNGICYLFGFDELRNAERIFSLSRMKNIILTEQKFNLPKDFEFNNRLGNSNFGGFFSSKKEHYKIEFYGEARTIIKERKWAENQTFKESKYKTTIEFESTQSLKIKNWVLSNGSNARPIKPDWLFEAWKQNVLEMSRMLNWPF